MEEDIGPDPALSWIERIAEGDRGAFENLYNAYQTRLFRYLSRMVNDANLAEELTNDVMVAVWKGAAGFKGQSKPSTWLFGIARHKALNELRRPRPMTVEVETASAVAASETGPEGIADRNSVRQNIQRALEDLSPEHREVVELTFFQGLTYQEIAEIMQCPINTVKTRMFHAKKRLQEALRKRGIAGETL
jgi:RNA polymerase sigma-70 factor (ECF subfamily)